MAEQPKESGGPAMDALARKLIQVPKHSTWDHAERKKALRACLKAAQRAIRAQIDKT